MSTPGDPDDSGQRPATEPESAAEPEAKPDNDSVAEPVAPEPVAPEPVDPEPVDSEPVDSEPVDPEPLPAAPPPIMPTAAESVAARSGEPAPRLVQYGLAATIASGVLCVIAAVLALLLRQQQIEGQIAHRPRPDLTDEAIRNGVTTAAVLLLVGSLVYAAFAWLFGTKVREGVRKARSRLTLSVVLLGLFEFLFGSVISQFGVLIGLVGIALLYVPSVRDFFTAEPR